MPNAGDHALACVADNAPMDHRSHRRGCGFTVSSGGRACAAERVRDLNRARSSFRASTAGTLVHDVAFTEVTPMLRTVSTDAFGTQDVPTALVATVPWSTKQLTTLNAPHIDAGADRLSDGWSKPRRRSVSRQHVRPCTRYHYCRL
jgi:hypothetical protein